MSWKGAACRFCLYWYSDAKHVMFAMEKKQMLKVIIELLVLHINVLIQKFIAFKKWIMRLAPGIGCADIILLDQY